MTVYDVIEPYPDDMHVEIYKTDINNSFGILGNCLFDGYLVDAICSEIANASVEYYEETDDGTLVIYVF